MLSAMIASAFEGFTTRSQISGKEQVSKSSELRIPTRFLRGRQIAYMIYEYFRATGD